MPPPTEGSAVTADQVAASVNIASFPGAAPGRNWHIGQLEGWAFQFGYPSGMPVYGSVTVGGTDIHIYFLNDGHQQPIILRPGQTPADYDVAPTA